MLYKDNLTEKYQDNAKYLEDATKYMLDHNGLAGNKITKLNYSQYPSLLKEEVISDDHITATDRALSKDIERDVFRITAPNNKKDVLQAFIENVVSEADNFINKRILKNERAVYDEVLKGLVTAKKAGNFGGETPHVDVYEELEPAVKKLFNNLAQNGVSNPEEVVGIVKDIAKQAHFSKTTTDQLVEFTKKKLAAIE
jgi:hypothetical protein